MRQFRMFIQGAMLFCTIDAAAAGKDEFQALYDQASEAYLAGRFTDAIHSYQAAYKLKQLPRLLLMIGKSQLKTGAVAEAKVNLQWFLEVKPDAAESEEVQRLIQHCQKMLSPPKVDSSVASAPSAGSESEHPPARQQELARSSTSSGGSSENVGSEQDPSGQEESSTGRAPETPARLPITTMDARPSVMGPWSWTAVALTGGLGAAALGLGTAAEVEARNARTTAYRVDTQSQALSDAAAVRNQTVAAAVLGAVSATALVTTLTVIGVRSRRGSSVPMVTPSSDGKSVSLALAVRF